MAVLGAAIQFVQRSGEVGDDGQLAVGVADTQNPVDTTIADDDPIHIPSRALDTDVVQSGEALAAEKINSA